MTEHIGYIVAAFVVTGTVLAGLIVVTFTDYWLQRRALARLAPDRAVKP